MRNFVIKLGKCLLIFLVTLPFTLYFILLLVNLTDEEKSEQVLAFERILEQGKQIDDRKNAYISLVGITAKAEEDIFLIGQQHISLLRNHRATKAELPFIDAFDVDDFSAQLESIFSACQTASALNEKCRQHLLIQQDKIASLLNNNQLLLQRYRRLTELTQWYEILPPNISNYSGMRNNLLLSLQHLNLLASWQGAMSDKPEEVALLYKQQDRFLRNIFSSTHVLITKLIASSAIKRHLNWAVFILSNMAESPSKQVLKNSLVDTLSVPFSVQSLSLRNVFIGEWQFAESFFEGMWQGEHSNAWFNFFFRPMFQQQATANLSAKIFYEALKKPLKSDAETIGERPCSVGGTWQTLTWYSYNPVGKLFRCSSPIFTATYQKELDAVESLRKSVLAKLTHY